MGQAPTPPPPPSLFLSWLWVGRCLTPPPPSSSRKKGIPPQLPVGWLETAVPGMTAEFNSGAWASDTLLSWVLDNLDTFWWQSHTLSHLSRDDLGQSDCSIEDGGGCNAFTKSVAVAHQHRQQQAATKATTTVWVQQSFGWFRVGQEVRSPHPSLCHTQ